MLPSSNQWQVPVLGLVNKASLNGCFWIGFLRWERRLSSFFCMVVHDCDNTEESIGKTAYFNQDFPWHYLNSRPTQKRNSTVVFKLKNWSRNSRLNSLSWGDPKPVQQWPTGKNEHRPSVLFFLIFSWPHTIQGKLPYDQFFTCCITPVSTPKVIPCEVS